VQFGRFQSLAEPEDCLVNRNRELDAKLRAHSSGVDVHLVWAMHISTMDQWERSRQGSGIIPKLVITPAFVLLRF